MAHSTKSQDLKQAQCELMNNGALPFSHLLPRKTIERVCAAIENVVRGRIYTPAITLWMFLSQVYSQDHSCREAVAEFVAWRAAEGLAPCSANTASYCEARKRLPLELLQTLTRETGRQAPEGHEAWLWKGRHVKVVDGTTVDMPDTPANQEKFPQSTSQKKGIGFPVARMLVVFSLAWATALELAIGPAHGKKTGEISLFRSMLDVFDPGDIVLGDRLFDSYRDIATLRARQVDVVFRMNASRKCDFRRGRWLATLDHIVTWKKPKFDSNRFDRETYDALPDTMLMREIRYQVSPAGFRSREIRIVTTLLDAELYSKEDIAQLYRQRWHCELDLRSLKITLNMKHLRCKTPEMVEKEVWAHFLGYNLMRQTMALAAAQEGVMPRCISFKGALQTVNSFTPYMAPHPERYEEQWATMLKAIATHTVGDRPDRVEPRKIKYRPGKYPYLTQPRNDEQQKLCA